MDWHTFFAGMPDYRVNRRKKHHLVDILVIALCALISGADDFEEIEAYGRRKEAFLRTFLDLAHGIPSHDTFTRVFRRMDTAAFGRCLYAWSAQVLAGVEGPLQTVSVDGKVLRGTAQSGAKKSGICIVSAWASAHSLVLGQEKVAAKSNEKTAIPDLLRALDLRQTLVSCDAAGGKIKKGQAERFILNLEDSKVDIAALRQQFTQYPVAGLKEIIVVKQNKVVPFFP